MIPTRPCGPTKGATVTAAPGTGFANRKVGGELPVMKTPRPRPARIPAVIQPATKSPLEVFRSLRFVIGATSIPPIQRDGRGRGEHGLRARQRPVEVGSDQRTTEHTGIQPPNLPSRLR